MSLISLRVRLRWLLEEIVHTAAWFLGLTVLSSILVANATAQIAEVDATSSHVVNTFSPLYALESTVDRVPGNATDVFFEPDQIKQTLEAGWGALSYRQNTDLFVQAWHWNPEGTWSDGAGKGYFVGDANPGEKPIRHSYGYQLRHRGFRRNNGTEFDGFSRLDDGDEQSYWKSNPYLSQAFTGEDDSLHPQWVVVNLGSKQQIDAIRIAWAEPYAKAYEAQHWVGDGDAMDEQDKGEWKTFPSGALADGHGGQWALLLINKDYDHAHSVKIEFHDAKQHYALAVQ